MGANGKSYINREAWYEQALTLQRYGSLGGSLRVPGDTRVVPDVVRTGVTNDERHHDSVDGLLDLHRPITATRIHVSVCRQSGG